MKHHNTFRCATPFAVIAAALISSPAMAQLPDPVRAMIDAAIASGDADQVKTVIGLAKQTNPDDVAEIDALRLTR